MSEHKITHETTLCNSCAEQRYTEDFNNPFSLQLLLFF